MENRVRPRILRGFRDFLPAEQARRAAVLAKVSRAFESCSFAPISTPAVEYLDVLTGKYGDEGDKLLYQFKDHGDRDVALRYDLTVPLARVVAQHRDLPVPFKRYQVGTVWRAEKPAHGRFREFVQCDADIVGSASPLADADCIAAGITALRALGIERFQVRISHRAVLNALMIRHGIEETSAQVGTLRTLDKLDKIGADKVREILGALDGVGPGPAGTLLEALREYTGESMSVISRLGDDLGNP
ncbi:MAG: histidine--tRNA ligase, partial [Deltaproteobacteria bacterium]|nr:histidine--tRNA ligase [Deltaproteobacteria bacterium]